MSSRRSNRTKPFSAPQVAELSGLAVSTVYEGVKTGEIPGVIRVGRCIRFSRVIIKRWLAGKSERV